VKQSTKAKIIGSIFGAIIAIPIVAVISMAIAIAPWLAWNLGVAPLFHWPKVTYWQCFGLMWALSILKSFIFPSKD